ncbi:MAG: hypothetical protein AVDCRST_MAG59-853, partial [uncultured Thermomicrobiales bacterium]
DGVGAASGGNPRDRGGARRRARSRIRLRRSRGVGGRQRHRPPGRPGPGPRPARSCRDQARPRRSAWASGRCGDRGGGQSLHQGGGAPRRNPFV